MKLLSLLCFLAVAAFGQRGTYQYEKETSLSAASEKVTLQLPANTGRTIKMVGISVYCSVACTATLSRDGTAATTTAGVVTKLNNGSVGTSAAAYHTSNVGTSTTIKTYTVPAGSEVPISLPDKGLLAGENLSLGTNSITGTARIFFQWREY